MTPGWASELSRGAAPDLVARVLRLAATPWVTADRLRRAVAALLDRAALPAEAVLDAVEAVADDDRPLAGPATVEAAARELLAHHAVVHVVGERGYPSLLASAWPELGAPLWLFVRAPDGRLPAGPAAAVVGTRRATLDGLRTTRLLAGLLARHGVTVVSGMARGIDQAAHGGALAVDGVTVAVLGTGFGVDYPAKDGAAREAVAAAGGLVTEYLPGTPPRGVQFLWRNRIVAGLADVTVVVEGRARSGALHTARLAASQGREVMAVPGSLNAPASRAPLDLIRDGATPLTRLEDVFEPLGIATADAEAQRRRAAPPQLSPVAAAVLPLLGPVPSSPGRLAGALGEPVAAVLAAVGELTRRGLAAATPRGVVGVDCGR